MHSIWLVTAHGCQSQRRPGATQSVWAYLLHFLLSLSQSDGTDSNHAQDRRLYELSEARRLSSKKTPTSKFLAVIKPFCKQNIVLSYRAEIWQACFSSGLGQPRLPCVRRVRLKKNFLYLLYISFRFMNILTIQFIYLFHYIL